MNMKAFLLFIFLSAAVSTRAGFVATFTLNSVARYFDTGDGEALDTYIQNFLSQNNVGIDFSNRDAVRRAWTASSTGSGNVRSILSYTVVFIGPKAQVGAFP